MSDHELNDLIQALETAYDLLKCPISVKLAQGDFEARRLDAVEKLIRAMHVMYLDIDDISDEPVFAGVAPGT